MPPQSNNRSNEIREQNIPSNRSNCLRFFRLNIYKKTKHHSRSRANSGFFKRMGIPHVKENAGERDEGDRTNSLTLGKFLVSFISSRASWSWRSLQRAVLSKMPVMNIFIVKTQPHRDHTHQMLPCENSSTNIQQKTKSLQTPPKSQKHPTKKHSNRQVFSIFVRSCH